MRASIETQGEAQMKKYQYRAYATNEVLNRHMEAILNGDDQWVDSSKSDGLECPDLERAKATFEQFATQAEANKFTNHATVTFELHEIDVPDDEDKNITCRAIEQKRFEVRV